MRSIRRFLTYESIERRIIELQRNFLGLYIARYFKYLLFVRYCGRLQLSNNLLYHAIWHNATCYSYAIVIDQLGYIVISLIVTVIAKLIFIRLKRLIENSKKTIVRKIYFIIYFLLYTRLLLLHAMF